MNLNGPAETVKNGTYPVSRGAIIPLATFKTVAMRSLLHLNIWVSREQRAKE
jgi:hypothetical protein